MGCGSSKQPEPSSERYEVPQPRGPSAVGEAPQGSRPDEMLAVDDISDEDYAATTTQAAPSASITSYTSTSTTAHNNKKSTLVLSGKVLGSPDTDPHGVDKRGSGDLDDCEVVAFNEAASENGSAGGAAASDDAPKAPPTDETAVDDCSSSSSSSSDDDVTPGTRSLSNGGAKRKPQPRLEFLRTDA